MTRSPRPTRNKPISARFFAVAALTLMALVASASITSPVYAQTLTEEEAVHRALERAELVEFWRAEADIEEAEAKTAAAWPNPGVEYSREQAFEEPDTVSEDFVILQQTLPLSGRRGRLADAARKRAEATRLESRAEARRISIGVRRTFYETLSLRRRIEIRKAWTEQMRDVERQMIQRIEAGESAPYEVERLRREIADVEADISTDEARLLRHRNELAVLLGLDAQAGDLRVEGDVLPKTLPSDAELRDAIEGRPGLRAATKRMDAARLRADAASRWWVPEPTLSGGYKTAGVGDERFHGFVIGLSLSVPLFDRLQGERAAASASLVREKNRRELIRQRIEAEAVGLASETRKLVEAAEAYEKAGVERAVQLLETTRQAYEGGELGILELIDAYRGAVDSRLRLLELKTEARRRQIELMKTLEPTGTNDVSTEDE